MQLSTTVLLSSVFSLSLALPSGLSEASSDPDAAPVAIPGRLNVSYTAITYKTLSNLHGPPKASPPFTIKAYNSESPIHLMDINASNDKFFVGNITGSSCPPTIPNCPVGNVTALQVTSTGGAHLVSGTRPPSCHVDTNPTSVRRCPRWPGHLCWATRPAEVQQCTRADP